jgi:hypothetical protein
VPPLEAQRRLAAAAVLGAERLGTTTAFPLPGPVTVAVGGIEGPAWVLAAAAGLGQFIAGGALPQRVEDGAMPAAPSDDDRPASGAVGGLLLRVAGEDARVMPECLGRLAALGLTMPFGALPGVLDLGARSRSIRRLVPPVLGSRGRWLASLNPDWAYGVGAVHRGASAGDTERCWETAGREERVELLRVVREADPARARGLVESTWEQDAAADRARFVEAFRIGLSMDDEALLERALDGRQAERVAASELLSALPESAMARRMAERALAIVSVRSAPGGVLRRRKGVALDASPPEAPDKAMKRDGVQGRQSAGLGARAAVLRDVIGLAPLGQLEAHHGVSTPDLLGAARESEWWAALREGWTDAVVRQQDPRWAALLVGALDAEELLTPERKGVLALLGGDEHGAALGGVLARVLSFGEASTHALAGVLGAIPGPWSERVSGAVAECLGSGLRAKMTEHDWYWMAECFDIAAVKAHPACLSALTAMTAGAGVAGNRREIWPRTAATLGLRGAFHEEMNRV